MDCSPDSRGLHLLGQEGSLLQNNPGSLVAHVDAQSLLVSNTLSQGAAAALSSFSFLFFNLVAIQYVKLDEGLDCLMEVTSFIYRLTFSGVSSPRGGHR